MVSSAKSLFILIFIPFSLSFKCSKNGPFNIILVNEENKYELSPDSELWYKYTLSTTKNKIGFAFSNLNSTSAEVVLYKSELDIDSQNYFDKFLISENTFKEIDVRKLEQNIFIVIKDNKNSKMLYNNIFIIYDTEIPIQLYNGKPTTMKFFFQLIYSSLCTPQMGI